MIYFLACVPSLLYPCPVLRKSNNCKTDAIMLHNFYSPNYDTEWAETKNSPGISMPKPPLPTP